MSKDRNDAMLAMSRSLSMPEAPFDDLITELGGADEEEEHPLSAGLATLDMQLPSMDLSPDMQGELLPGRSVPSCCVHPLSANPAGPHPSSVAYSRRRYQ